MRFVIGWHRVDGYLAAAVIQYELRFVLPRSALDNGELSVEPGEARGAGEDQLSTRHRCNVEVGNLIETAGEQSPCRIVRQRLVLAARGEQNDKGQVARPHERSERTQRQRHRLQNRKPRTSPPH